MSPYHVTVDPQADAEAVRRRRYGVIETCAGRLERIVWRPFPKIVTAFGIHRLAPWLRRRRRGNRCRLYFNEPRSCPGFLALRYVESTCDADYATFRRALTALEEVARVKNSDALLCDAANQKISDRFLARLGWVPHAPMPGHRNFIKRLK
ncbi:MAG: hypothetical protein JNK76_02025 [Planctomycetales bacterium]|jgi:hypothetical protein|nr:hypothetical protein [Planctomycetales bacterium]MBN8486666.1 hypothetical protein [Burkholderiales bacterium]MBN8628962.1 hypothetical protein [Planctomycetota bacterium]